MLQDFILSILHASPSVRDTKSYLKSFGVRKPQPAVSVRRTLDSKNTLGTSKLEIPIATDTASLSEHLTNKQIESILDPVHRHTALVKIQGPFNDRQLESIARGMVYLQKLGLVSVIVVERDDWTRGDEHERSDVIDEAGRVVKALEEQGARARPLLQAIARLGPKPDDVLPSNSKGRVSGTTMPIMDPPEAHASREDLNVIRCALRVGEIPVLAPFALDSKCRAVRIAANDVVAALARGMVEAAEHDSPSSTDFDLTPLRLMVINREGGIPSYARSGLPHLLVNLSSEVQHISETFQADWRTSHPTALANLRLAQTCLSYMPKTSSAVVVSHRSPRSLIANLITNKPAHSSSLPHALLSGPKAITPHTPTIIRHGLPIRVIRSPAEIDRERMTSLLEQSFGRTLNAEAFYARLDAALDFCIVAGDYAGAAVVTNENEPNSTLAPMAYLDKFAVLPEHQGDGTVDFLWVALHDESYGLGLASALNPNPGGMQGRGTGRDLVWRSRSNNPVNKWYFERSSGHMRIGKDRYWSMFWCDAEERLAQRERILKERVEGAEGAEWGAIAGGKKRWGVPGMSFVEDDEVGRAEYWARIVEAVPSSWT